MYTKVCGKVECIICTSCIHFVYVNSDLQKVYMIRTKYVICIQSTYKMYTNNSM